MTEIQNNLCVYTLINWGFQKGLNQFLTFYISADQKSPTENRFYIEEGGINIKDVTFYSSLCHQDAKAKLFKAYPFSKWLGSINKHSLRRYLASI